jgi:hypothetical protein
MELRCTEQWQLHAFLTLALDRGKQSPSRPGRFNPLYPTLPLFIPGHSDDICSTAFIFTHSHTDKCLIWISMSRVFFALQRVCQKSYQLNRLRLMHEWATFIITYHRNSDINPSPSVFNAHRDLRIIQVLKNRFTVEADYLWWPIFRKLTNAIFE